MARIERLEQLVILGPQLVAQFPGAIDHFVSPLDPVLRKIGPCFFGILLQELKRFFLHRFLIVKKFFLKRPPYRRDVFSHVSPPLRRQRPQAVECPPARFMAVSVDSSECFIGFRHIGDAAIDRHVDRGGVGASGGTIEDTYVAKAALKAGGFSLDDADAAIAELEAGPK